jgi:PAS domain S-box-containing protein
MAKMRIAALGLAIFALLIGAGATAWSTARRRRIVPRNLVGALGLLAAGLLATGIVALYAKADAQRDAQREFEFTGDEIQHNIVDRLRACAQILHSGAALFDASGSVGREEWRAFTHGLRLEQQLIGIQGVGFAQFIPRAQLAEHEQAIRREGFPDYQVKPAGDRETYSAIIYLEPFTNRNLRAFGYDMLSESVRRAALERARDQNTAALTGKVILVQETGQEVQAGTLMYLPVYRHGLPIETLEQRRAALQGWVYSPYRMTDLMRGTLGGWDVKEKHRQLRLQIYDGEVLSKDTLLYDSQSAADKALAATSRVTRLTPLDFAGRRWTLRFTQFSGLTSADEYGRVWLVLSSGTIISLLLFGLMLSLLSTRATARQMAEQFTSELRTSEERFTQIVEQSATIAWEVDPQGLYTYVSQVSEPVLGYRPDELVGRMHFYDLHPESGREAFKAAAFGIFEQKQAFQNLVNAAQTKDGRQVWLSTNGLPLLNADGSFRGYRGADTDITERKRAEEKLRQTTDRLSLAARAGGVGIWDYDVVNNRLVWDDQMFRLYGITRDQFSGAYQAWQAGLHPEDRQRGDEEIRLALRGEKDFNTEFRVVWPDGSQHSIRALALVQRDPSGQPVQMVGTNWDITAQKQTEAALRESEANFRTFFESMTDMIMVGTRDGRILFTNSAVTRTLGYSSEELAALHMLELHPADKRQEAEDIFTAMFQGTRESCPLPLARKDGGLVPVETRVWFGRWNGQDCVFGIAKNLTAEQEAQQRFERLFRHNPTLMALSSLPGRQFSDVNDAFLKTLGYSRGDIIGKTAEDFALFVHPEQQAALADKLRADGRIANFELQVRRQDGAILDGLFSGEVISSQGRQHFLTVMVDITERKQAEAALRDSLAEKTTLLQEVHHRVKNNLQIISSLLNLQADQVQDAAVLELLAVTRNRVGAMALLHENLYQSESLARLNLPEYVKSLCAHLLRAAGPIRARVQLECHVEPGTISLELDQAVPCGLLLNELVTNALKHAFPGERCGCIRVTLERATPQTVGLTVADDGVGLSVTLDPRATSSLGLQLVSLLTQQLHGTVNFERGQGTAVHILFPNSAETETAHE